MSSKIVNRVSFWVLIFSALLLLLSITWRRGLPINLKIEEAEAQTPIGAGGFPSYGEKEITSQVINLPKIRVFKKQQGIIAPVTDPKKMVTDPVLLKELRRQGIDEDYVELFSDYAPRSRGEEHSPYARFYRDLKSGKRFMVVHGLPMVIASGERIVPGWDKLSPNKFRSKVNLFSAEVEGNQVKITVLNDQPDARKKNDWLAFRAQLFLNGIEQQPKGPILLTTDPVNPNYQNNTLEWGYGICKRRLRIIEGKFLGSWVFESNPGGEVRIKYNQAGDYRLKLGQYKTGDDEELVPAQIFNRVQYPFTVNDSATYYPDANPETSSVDGYAFRNAPGPETWATIRADAGTTANDSQTSLVAGFDGYPGGSNWLAIYRSIALFDTDGLPDSVTVTAATLSVYGNSKYDYGSNSPDINVYSATPASNTAVVATDYGQTGATAFATAITYANFSTTGYNDLVFNSTGIAAISKTGVSKFALRNANFDVSGATPTWGNYHGEYFYSSEQGAGYKPKLVVTYSEGGVDALLLGGD